MCLYESLDWTIIHWLTVVGRFAEMLVTWPSLTKEVVNQMDWNHSKVFLYLTMNLTIIVLEGKQNLKIPSPIFLSVEWSWTPRKNGQADNPIWMDL